MSLRKEELFLFVLCLVVFQNNQFKISLMPKKAYLGLMVSGLLNYLL